MARRNPAHANTFRPAVERLEGRDTPAISTGIEDLASLPHLSGMGDSYPVETPIPARTAPPTQTATQAPVMHEPLRAQVRPRLAVAATEAGQLRVSVYDGPTYSLMGVLTPNDPAFAAGANVATGDLTGDHVADIVLAQSAGGSAVAVYDGVTLAPLAQFVAYSPSFKGGVSVAVGDLDGDGRADLVTGAGAGGGPHVQAFHAADILAGRTAPFAGFFAYEPEFRGGVSVAVADVDRDGWADIVTGAGAGGGPRVRVVSGRDGSALQDFYAFDLSDRHGVRVAAGDFGDGRVQLAAIEPDAGTSVRLYHDGGLTREVHALTEGQTTHDVTAQDLTGAGRELVLVTGGRGGSPRVAAFDGLTGAPAKDFPAFAPAHDGGLSVG